MMQCLFVFDELILGFVTAILKLETGGFELASNITLVLQGNQLSGWLKHPIRINPGLAGKLSYKGLCLI